MKTLHLILLAIIAACIGIVMWQRVRDLTEPFENGDDKLVFTDAHCGLLLNQKRGMEESIQKANAENKNGMVKSYTAMLDALNAQILTIGCKGDEPPSQAPLALPASMSASDISSATQPVATI